jgi:hypothetical protein
MNNPDDIPTTVDHRPRPRAGTCFALVILAATFAGASMVAHHLSIRASREAVAACEESVAAVATECQRAAAACAAGKGEVLEAVAKRVACRPCPKAEKHGPAQLKMEDF